MRTDKKKQPKKIMDGTVIDENLLLKAVRDYMVENKIIQRQAIDLAQIKTLPLSFLNIWKIQYLQCLDKLEKLQLDNNIIEKIENLDHLTNLKWLDLSFNRITKIQGFDKLVNLTDISLYNNRIEILEGLGNCSKLNVFSIGNNKIKTFEEVISYFGRGLQKKTKFKYLQVLNVFGNPFSLKDGIKDPEYQNHMISHLPNLRYLDYVFIDEDKRKSPGVRQIDEKFKTEDQAKYLIELKIEEDKERGEWEQKKKKQSAKMHLIENFPQQLVEQEQLQKLNPLIKGLDDETVKFTSKVKEIVEIIQKKIKQKNEDKLKDVEKFQISIKHRERQAEKETIGAIEGFQKEKKIVVKYLQSKVQGPAEHQQIQKLVDKTEVLKDKLLAIQIQLMEDIQNNLRSFTNVLIEYSKVMQGVLAGQSGYFKKIDDEIKEFGVKLQKICKQAVDNAQKQINNGQQDGDVDLNAIIEMKESLSAIISSIKERLGEKRIRAETTVVQQLCQRDVENYIKQFNEKQYQRSRKNISNIKSTINDLAQKIRKLKIQEEEDD